MWLEKLTHQYLPAVEASLQQAVARLNGADFSELHRMMAYHMGWQGHDAGPEAQGKRIRPLLVLLSTAACQADWQSALPAATAIELVHNFSLIHDDIEDNSPLRRGRPTVWTRWGIPQAINTGDAMFTLAHLVLLDLVETANEHIAFQAARILQQTCLQLTQGQFLDMSYEQQRALPIAAYWPMVSGKTAALLSACTEIGALVAGVTAQRQQAFRTFGLNLGLAFQALDDLLGIWGDADKIGKSATSDLVEGKKSLPVLYGLAQQGEFARQWLQGPVAAQQVPALAALLEAEGARNYTQQEAERLTEMALQALQQAKPQGEAGQALSELANQLLKRQL
ncbi:MAG: polyprenyl synthetase family protein [Anaerolineales bacterium]|nr:polyprenyl synthetase family protein [Anaerolineales bacterium]